MVTQAELSSELVAVSLPATAAAPERRTSRRFACEGTARVIVLGGALNFVGKLQDLSISGCCVVTEVAFTLERGTQVEVLMQVNRTNFRVAAGVRANHQTRGVGLEFVSVSERCAQLIHDLIADLEESANPHA